MVALREASVSLVDDTSRRTDDYPDTVAMLDEFAPDMEDHALFMAQMQARSHRGVFVGACALVSLPGGALTFLDGANCSPKEGVRKRCAEMWILWKAAQLGCTAIHGMTVVGPGEPEKIASVSGAPTPTLHSCYECLVKMVCQRRYRRLIAPDMQVRTAGAVGDAQHELALNDVRESLTVSQMWQRVCDEGRPASSREKRRGSNITMPVITVPPGWGGRPLSGPFTSLCVRSLPRLSAPGLAPVAR